MREFLQFAGWALGGALVVALGIIMVAAIFFAFMMGMAAVL